jgi:tyrosinase
MSLQQLFFPTRIRSSLLGLMASLVIAGCGSSFEDPIPVSTGNDVTGGLVRYSVNSLTPQQRADFVNAVKRMKEIPSSYRDGVNAYDYFVILHTDAFHDHMDEHGNHKMPNAHMHPNFLPWHREFLRRFDHELQRAGNDPTLTVPYWDWIAPGSFESVFADDFLGGDGDPDDDFRVKTGPFRAGEWEVLLLDTTDDEWDGDQDLDLKEGPLQRKFGDGAMPTTEEVLDAIFTYRPYDAAPWNQGSDINNSFRNYLEGWWPTKSAMHNAVHVYVGGQMQTGSSPNDPAFFLHHANVDRLWALYQATWGNQFPEEFADEPLYKFDDVTAVDTYDLFRHSGVRYE